MKKDITCSIVQDLLPSYIEHLTSEETNLVVKEHLETCEECRSNHEAMVKEVTEVEKAPKAELKFFRKIRKTKLIAAGISILLTLILTYVVYAMEFSYALDKTELSLAVSEFTAPFDHPVDAYVLETHSIGRDLFVSFKDRNQESVNGIAQFVKGVNNRYRILRVQIRPSEYSSVVQHYSIESGKERYIAVSGYNLSEEIAQYGLDYSAYTMPGDLSDYRIRIPVKFDKDNLQFLHVYEEDELLEIVRSAQEITIHNPRLTGSSFYDEKGNEITENFRLAEEDIQQGGYGGGKAELFLLYVFMGIIAGFGVIMARYFLTD